MNIEFDAKHKANEFVRTFERKEIEKKVIVPKYMWRHNNKIRMNWDLLVIMLALYNCVMIPFNVAFPDDNESLLMTIFNKIIDVLFGLDIALNFRTTYINPLTNVEIMDAKKIALNYTKSNRFAVDLLASIPFEVFFELFKDENSDSGGDQSV